MSINRYDAKADANQPEIVKHLRGHGCIVELIKRPFDLLVGWDGKWVVLEVKMPSGKMNAEQTEKMGDYLRAGLPFYVVYTKEEAARKVFGNN